MRNLINLKFKYFKMLAGSSNDLTKEELMSRVRALETHVDQLQNIIAKRTISNVKLNAKKARPFDFKRYQKRHVALKLSYLGWDYSGLAVQEDTQNTIESKVFDALIKTRLIESRETSNYHRCGRTDKEVSAFGQVLSIDLRSKRLIDEKLSDTGDPKDEINYCHILNKVLPSDIRALAWAPVPQDFSARFNCTSRTYKYFFPKGDLNIERMRNACGYLVGEHDFRNLCKMDVANGVTSFVRRIISVSIDSPSHPSDSESTYDLYHATIKGKSFLWHQIRCILAVLFLIGRGLEEPTVIRELLDVEKYPTKPQYNMADGYPLVLFDCEFENVKWIYESEAFSNTVGRMQKLWSSYAVRAQLIKNMLSHMETVQVDNAKTVNISKQGQSLVMGSRSRIHKPLLVRPRCESLENRLRQLEKRKKK